VLVLQLARQTIDAFENAQTDAVIINAAGCGSNVKEYGHLLRDDPQHGGRAKAFATKCRDVSEFLAELGPSRPGHRVSNRRPHFGNPK
jgi:glycolate oxidase iron-sulfur subunit